VSGRSGGKRLLRSFAAILAWPIIKICLAVAPQTWRALAVPSDSPHVVAGGADPDRVLLLGSGRPTGFGVHTHELGLGGHLARELSSLTTRGCSVDILSDPSMSSSFAGIALSRARLEKFDALVVTLGNVDTFRMRWPFAWRRDVTDFLDSVEETGGDTFQSFIVGIPPADDVLSMPAPFIYAVNATIAHLNAVMEELCAQRRRVTFVPTTPPDGSTSAPFESRTYEHWARELAPVIAKYLADVTVVPTVREPTDAGTAELDNSILNSMTVFTSLTNIVDSMRLLLDTSGAAIAFDSVNAPWFISPSGDKHMHSEEAGEFFRPAGGSHGIMVINDATSDRRFVDHPWVVGGPRIRFFAGIPIAAPNGDALGTVFVFDSNPRTFDSSHETLLRELALRTHAAIQQR